MSQPDLSPENLSEVAAQLAERVWERYDVDLDEDLLPEANLGEEDPGLYDALMVEFVSHLLSVDGLTRALQIATDRANKKPANRKADPR